MEECQEPRCRSPGIKNWHGRKVCQDHYDTYQEQEEKMLNDLRDF